MKNLKKTDREIASLIVAERKRQEETLMMIPSENIASKSVEEAVGSCLGNKYAEGYAFRRYYQGQEFVDQVETIAIERAKKLFGVPFVNVQPYSGSPANTAVYFALIKPGDTIMGLSLAHGGHLTHGASVSLSGSYFKSVSYGLDKNGIIDYKEVERLALLEKPKVIVAGVTAYPPLVNWKKFAEIADKVGAYLLADISHLSGLIASGVYPSPVPYVHIIMTTTHKTLRGPRGAMLMVTEKGLKKDPDLGKKINKAVFPGLQGGPHINSIAGIAVALKEASSAKYKKYAQQIINNAKKLGEVLKKNGFTLVSGGTESHLLLVDLSNKGVIGNLAAEALEAANITLNRNAVPFDANPPFYPSGMRLGTPGITSRGMKEKEMEKIGKWITEVIEDVARIKKDMKIEFAQEKQASVRKEIIAQSKKIKEVKKLVIALCKKFPIKDQY